jgi:hypothetical protein
MGGHLNIHRLNLSHGSVAMNCLTEKFRQNILSQSVVETYKLFSACAVEFQAATTGTIDYQGAEGRMGLWATT